MEDQLNNKEIDIIQSERKEDGSEKNLWKVSASALPTIKDAKSTYVLVGDIGNDEDWILGKIDNTHLSLNYYLELESNYYRILVNNNSYRIIVNKYDQNDKNIGYQDLCNGDILSISQSVKYITITIYKYENRQLQKHSSQDIWNDLKNGLTFNLSKIDNLADHLMDKEQLTSEINIESLSNYYNYRTGWYKSWGGTYENKAGSLCTRNFYKVDHKPYIFNVNDSRISLAITEYDDKGKWLKYHEALKNGDKFIKQPTTSYIGLTIRSRKWGVDLFALFENGLRLDLASEQYINKTVTVNISDADFSKTVHWKTGSYLYETGEYILDNNKICYNNFCRVEDKDYVVNLPGGYLKMSILELSKDGYALLNNELQSGQKWRKSKDTDKIAITIYGYNKTFTLPDYQRFIADYPAIGLSEYIRYTHNTIMKDITAGQFINTVNVGWNLGNSLDSKSTSQSKTANLKQELNWGNPYITKDLINYIASIKFNTIRIPVTWYYNTYIDANGNLKINEEWMNRVQDVVDYAMAANLYVILNTHHEQPIIYAGTDDNTMKQVLKNAQAIWTDIAERFKTYDEHLIFESYNEVDNIEKSWNYSDRAATQMNELNQIFVDTVRNTGNNNSKRILMVPTLLDGADSRFYTAFRMPRDTVANKIVVQVHIYTKKFNQNLDSDFIELLGFSNTIKAPIIIGEFGTNQAYPLPELRAEQASNFVARAAAHGIKCIWWDNGSDYKIVDRRAFSDSNSEMINALLEGTKGIGYQVEQEIVLNKSEQFVYLTPNIQTGKLSNTYWGTMTTDIGGTAVQIKAGSTCTVSIKTINKASSVWLQRLLFYNGTGELVQPGKEIQSKYYIGAIPQGAVTSRVSFNSPTLNITFEDYKKYLNSGEIELSICFFHPSDVKKVILPIIPYNI